MPNFDSDVIGMSTESFLGEPAAQIEERDVERDQVLSSAPQIRGAVDNLNRRADFYDGKNSISAEDRKDKEKFWHLFEAHATIATLLRTEALILEGKLEEYTEE